MKKLAIIPFVVVSLNLKAEELCAIDDSQKVIDELHSDTCDVIDKKKSCAEKFVDPDLQRKKIEGWFKVAEERKEKILKDKKAVPKTSYGGLFQQDATGETLPDKQPEYHLTHINDFMTFNGKIQNEKTAKLKEFIVEKFVKFSETYACDPIIKTEYTHTIYPLKEKFRSKEQFEEYIENDEFIKERDEHFKKMNTSENGEVICDPTPGEIRAWEPYSVEYPPCAGNVAGFFKDNEWTTSTLDKNMNSPETNELAACIKDRLSRGGVIEKIQIESSASALNNSGEAAKRFCKKGFQELAEARGVTARDKIVPQLFSKAGYNATGMRVHINSSGSNGDGTSGPCPYTLKDGVEKLKDEYLKAENKKALDQHKFVKINVSFKEISKRVTGEKHFAQSYKCRKFKFECLKKPGKESKVGDSDPSLKQ